MNKWVGVFIALMLTLYAGNSGSAAECPFYFPSSTISDPPNDQAIASNDITSVTVKQISNTSIQIKVSVRGNPADLRRSHYLVFFDADNNAGTGRFLPQYNLGEDFAVRIAYDEATGRYLGIIESFVQGNSSEVLVLLRGDSVYVVIPMTSKQPAYAMNGTIKFAIDVVNVPGEGDFVPAVGSFGLIPTLPSLPVARLSAGNTIFESSPHSMYLNFAQRNTPVPVTVNANYTPDGVSYFSSKPAIAQVVGNGLITNFDIINEKTNSDYSWISAHTATCDLMIEDSIMALSGPQLFKSGKAAFLMPPYFIYPNTGQRVDLAATLSGYDAAGISSLAIDIQTELMGHIPADGNNRIFAFNYAACGWAGQPIWLGGGCVIQPYVNGEIRPGWGILYHEVGHVMLHHVFSKKMEGLHKDWLGYSEGWATLNGMYTVESLIQESAEYGLTQKQVDSLIYERSNSRNFLTSRDCQNNNPGCYASLWAYENVFNNNYAKLDANIMDGMFIYLAEQTVLNPRGWEVYPRFYRAFLPEVQAQFMDLGDRPSGNAYFVAALSAAAGSDLRPLFRDRWQFPINDVIYNLVFPTLNQILADTTPPTISAVLASAISAGGATVSWKTNEVADGQIEYGPTTSYGSTTPLAAAMAKNHVQALTGLTAGTLYHYRIKTKDASGNLAASADFTLSTLAAPNPIGTHDDANCTQTWGWTCDADNFGAALDVHFYLDGPAGMGTILGGTIANLPREDGVGAACGGNAGHGFVFPIPVSIKDGNPHTIYAYALNIGPAGHNPLLANSPLSITCSPPPLPPTITQPPMDRTVVAGQAVTFSVSATGTAPLTYQWYKNSVALPSATQASYVIPQASLADDGAVFYVVVNNPSQMPVTSGTAALRVTAAPLPNEVPVGSHESSGCAATRGWTCDGNNFASALEVHFYLDGPAGTGVILGGTTANVSREAVVASACGGNPNHGFVFPTPDSIKDGNPHTIYAYAINIGPAGHNPLLIGSPRSITCSASVPLAPLITQQPSDAAVKTGQAVTFSVLTAGTAPFTYQWYKNGSAIGSATGSSYTVPAASIENDGAAFYVIVNNVTNIPITSRSAILHVTNPAVRVPTPVLNLPAQLPVDGAIQLIIEPGYPNLTFFWTFTPDSPQAPKRTAAFSNRAPATGFSTSSREIQLASYALLPGPYQVAVYAQTSTGERSDTAYASVTLVSGNATAVPDAPVRVYPNPWRADRHSGAVTFASLSGKTTIKIFNASAYHIKTLSTSDTSIPWDLTNEAGQRIASGVYHYLLTNDRGQKIKGQIAVIK